MCSTEISTLLTYEPQPITTRCGEVFCSANLETFLITCTTCSQQFNLLSCNLFIKHFKECKPCTFVDPGDPNSVYGVPGDTNSAEITNYTIDNLLKDALISDMDEVENNEDHDDPLMALKLEMEKEKEEPPGFEETFDEMENYSDYQEEDDLTIDKVIYRKKIDGIIDEYKKHPILYDSNLVKTASAVEKKHHYKQIRKAMNTKFKMVLSYSELHQHILRLRNVYRQVLKRKQSFEKFFTDGSTCFNPKLWYFDKISFIAKSLEDPEADKIIEETIDVNAITNDESSENEDSDSTNGQQNHEQQRKKRERDSCKILSEQNIIADLIAQYKKYPFLWDQTAPLYSSKYARKDAFRKITNHINKKYLKNVTDRDVRQQIVNLRSGYRRVQRKKHDADYRISLWYFDDLSFIDRKANEEENCVIPEDSDNNENPLDTSCNSYELEQKYNDDEEDNADNTDGSKIRSRQKRERDIVMCLIEEYKEHPCLYDFHRYKTTCRYSRSDAITEIKTTINNKFNTSFTDADIKNKIAQLRSSYRRVLRNKEAFEKLHANANRKFHPQWRYFDKLSFIGKKNSDFILRPRKNQISKQNDYDVQNETKKENITDESDDESVVENDIGMEMEMETEYHQENENKDVKTEEPSEDEEVQKTNVNPKSIVKNKELLTAIIEEYKNLPCLWAVQHYTNDNLYRREAFDTMAKNINDKFNTTYTYKDMSHEIVKLRATYKRMLRRRQENPNGDKKVRVWYADLLSFIGERKTKNQSEDNQDSSWNNDQSNVFRKSEGSTDEEANEVFSKKGKIKTKEHVFEMIDLYKDAPILWDTKHPQHVLRTERRKTIQKITDVLRMEHDCNLTVEEFRYHIRFLRESYFRALRHEIAGKEGDVASSNIPKPFYYDRMSFLEPFAEKTPTAITETKVSEEPPINKDLSFLVENMPLMVDFIQMYQAHTCLWDQKDKDRQNQSAHLEAYNKFINLFSTYNITFTKEQVILAIKFLHTTVVKTQRAEDFKTPNSQSQPTPWFYEHLSFLGRIPRVKEKYCSHCDQHFHTLAAYEKHKIEIAGDYPYKCSVCKAGFISRSKYAYHQITHKEPHKCDQCGFQAYDKHNFNVHMRRHKGIFPFKCQECDKGFVTSTELNRHTRMHTGERPFICDICGKTLPANSEFRQHMKRHSNQRDHKCELCGSAFFTPKTLRDHMASHSAERKHICETCGAAFKRKKTLLQHKALHAEKKKHECKICGKLFAQKAGVYSHMKSHGLMAGS